MNLIIIQKQSISLLGFLGVIFVYMKFWANVDEKASLSIY